MNTRARITTGAALVAALGASGAILTASDDHKPSTLGAGTISRVVDGDTVHVTLDGQDQAVRLIGINTPETVKPRTPVMCGGPEASASMHQLAPVGARVRVVTDPGPGKWDRYGRLLAYLYVNRRDVNAEQVRRGLAVVNGYGNPFHESAHFQRLQADAKAHGRGVWGECGGNFNPPR
jgi:micrococcal nuclease